MIVTKIWERNGTTLIEWTEDSELRRTILPSREVVDGECANPEMGMEYGVPWAELFSYHLDPKDVERKLHNAGIWTEEDVHRNPKLLQGIAVEIAGEVLHNLLRSVKVGLRNKE